MTGDDRRRRRLASERDRRDQRSLGIALWTALAVLGLALVGLWYLIVR